MRLDLLWIERIFDQCFLYQHNISEVTLSKLSVPSFFPRVFIMYCNLIHVPVYPIDKKQHVSKIKSKVTNTHFDNDITLQIAILSPLQLSNVRGLWLTKKWENYVVKSAKSVEITPCFRDIKI